MSQFMGNGKTFTVFTIHKIGGNLEFSVQLAFKLTGDLGIKVGFHVDIDSQVTNN